MGFSQEEMGRFDRLANVNSNSRPEAKAREERDARLEQQRKDAARYVARKYADDLAAMRDVLEHLGAADYLDRAGH